MIYNEYSTFISDLIFTLVYTAVWQLNTSQAATLLYCQA